MAEATPSQIDMFAVCKHPDCNTVIDMTPQKTLPNGKRPAPKQVRGLCIKHAVAEWRSKKKHTAVCIVCNDSFRTSRAKAFCCSKKCSQLVGAYAANEKAKINATDRRLRRRCNHCAGSIPFECNLGTKYCGSDCRDKAAKERALAARGSLRRCIEDSDYPGMVTELLKRVSVEGEFGCWVWPSRDRNGYSKVTWSRTNLYRLVLEVKHGRKLGSQAAHHICSNRACVRPEHLQPVTHRENIAEMLARRSYLARIEELENRLREYNADDPLLQVIEVA